ncbi:MAG: glutamine synthetase beta-grasp domain-containing protein [Patescibacteria group bacterium]|nr:glutamine synthetase beta-grasp domain-containing protein [Patescibacteria group bacterium]
MKKTSIIAEYIWMDNVKPTAKLRSKSKIIPGPIKRVADIPLWSFDGSSTNQAEGNFSDCLLHPVYFVSDPVRGNSDILVMCEVLNSDGTSHPTNTRAVLKKVATKYQKQEPWFGFEQEYTLYCKNRPLGWPEYGFPHPQGRYYCGIGIDEVYGRPVTEDHLQSCLKAGIAVYGVNAEVMPSQWEFQLGPLPPLELADQLWLARWLLYRLGENHNVYAKLDPKPMPGDWNGAGGHTNFSTKAMRAKGGLKVIETACKKLGKFHKQHIAIYGADNDKRLIGQHETCSIHQFRYGVSDRGASIRIPAMTAHAKRGYLEDRRPAANADPYQVLTALLETTCGQGFDPKKYNWEPQVEI